MHIAQFILWICVTHHIYTIADITEASVVWHAIAAMVLTTKISTSPTVLTVTMFVVEVAERWSA